MHIFDKDFGNQNKYKLYQVDAFAEKLFGEIPAAVCPLNKWLDGNLLQKQQWRIILQKQHFMLSRISVLYQWVKSEKTEITENKYTNLKTRGL